MLCFHCRAEVESLSGTCPHCGKDLADSSSPTARIGSPGKSPTLSLNPGQSFGDRYTIVEEVGTGGMGQVYKARDRELGRTVALKLIPPSPEGAEMVERFRRELNLAREVTHPNVCRVFDLGESEGIRFISMEYVDGQNLHDWIQAVGRLSPHQTMTVAKQICNGLEAIHIQNIVHRDLKPGNIMLDRSGRAVVMDFGLAYHPDADHITAKGEALGTLAYLSPEQARGTKVDSRSDIYTLGLVLFEMLTGKRAPADGKRLPLALRDREERCPPPSRISPEVPRALDAVVLRCVEKAPEERFQSVGEVRRALEKCDTGTAAPPPQEEPAPRPPRPRGLWYGLGAVAAAALLIIIIRTILPPPVPAASSLAVLPLDYEGPSATSYMESLVPLIIIRNLQELPDLEVAPFESSRSFGSGEEHRQVAEQLGVESLVQGKVKVEGEALELELALVTFDDEGESLWTEQYVGESGTVLETVDQASSEIVGALGRASAGGGQSTGLNRQAFEHYLEGKHLLEGWDVERNYEHACEAFQKALVLDSSFAEAHAGLALGLWKQYAETRRPELVEQALNEAGRAVSLGPSLPESHLAFGEVQLGRGHSAEAAASFEKALGLAPADDAICRRIAIVYARLQRNDEAEKMYKRAIALRPGFWENYNSQGIFYLRTGRLPQATEAFREVIRRRPESEIGYSNLATVYLLSGEPEQAEPLLQAALRINRTTRAHSNLGFVYYSSGRFEEAAEEFRKATEISPDFCEAYGNLGDAYRQLGRTDMAGEAYARAIELGRARLLVNPSNAEARAVLAMNLAGVERCSEARDEAARSTDESPGNPTIHYYAAVAYAICGGTPAAVRHAAEAIKGGVVADVRTNPDLKLVREDSSIRELLR